MQEIFEYFYKL